MCHGCDAPDAPPVICRWIVCWLLTACTVAVPRMVEAPTGSRLAVQLAVAREAEIGEGSSSEDWLGPHATSAAVAARASVVRMAMGSWECASVRIPMDVAWSGPWLACVPRSEERR